MAGTQRTATRTGVRVPLASAPTGRLARSNQEPQWRMLGACRGLDPEIFYPGEEDDPTEGKAVCASCGVQVACLEYALRYREKDGIWGGCTERERRRIIRQRRRSA